MRVVCALFVCHNLAFCQHVSITDALLTPGRYTPDYHAISSQDLEQFSKLLSQRVQKARQRLRDRARSERTFENTYKAYDQLIGDLTSAGSLSYILGVYHEKSTIRKKALDVLQLIYEMSNDLNNDPGLLSVLREYSTSPGARHLNPQKQELIAATLKSFEDENTQGGKLNNDSLSLLDHQLDSLQREFLNNIRSDTLDTLFVPLKESNEMPLERLTGLNTRVDGCSVPLTAENYKVLIRSSLSDSMKCIIYRCFHARGEKRNPVLMKHILLLRKEKAALSGFPSFSAFAVHNTILKEPRQVDSLLRELVREVRPLALSEYTTLLEKKRRETSSLTSRIFPWEIQALSTPTERAAGVIASSASTRLFDLESTIRALFVMADKLFQLRFHEMKSSGWHPDVRLFSVVRRGRLVGRVYLDILPRSGKSDYNETVAIEVNRGVGEDHRIPVIALVGKFQHEHNGSQRFLAFTDVESLFHEFGHTLHFLLGNTEFFSQSVRSQTAVFKEAISEFFGLFCREYPIMSELMNKGNDDGGDFQKEFENVVAMNSVTRNLRHLNSISMAYFDFYLHSRYDPAGNQSVSQVYDSLSALMDLWPAVKGNHNESSFYHFATMPCGYYTYLLSGEIARRWFDVFFRDRTMRWTLGSVFEQLVLRNGTTVPESTMMTQFENLK